MYGMIHQGMQSLIIENYGDELWKSIEIDLSIGAAELISAQVYDDTLTMAILSHICNIINMSIDECLYMFGEHWIEFADRGPYSNIMDFTGRTMNEFIGNLDRLHKTVSMAMPNARMPGFEIVSQSDNELYVVYTSQRKGLEPFVRGLLSGIAKRFKIDASVTLKETSQYGSLFVIEYIMDDNQ